MTKYSKKIRKITKNKTKWTKRRRYNRKNSMRNNRLRGGGEIRTLPFNVEGFAFILTKQLGYFGTGGNAAKYKLGLVHTDKSTREYIKECNLLEFIKQLKNNIMVMIGLYNDLNKISTRPQFYFDSLFKELNKEKEYASQIVSNLRKESVAHTVPNIRTDFNLRLSLPDNTQFNHLSSILTGDTFCIALTHIFTPTPTPTEPNDRIKQIVYKYCKEILKALLCSNLQDVYSNLLNIYRDFEISKINPELPTLLPADNTPPPRINEKLNHPPVKATLNKNVYSLIEGEFIVITGCATLYEGSIVMMREVRGYSRISSQICKENAETVFCNLKSAYYDCNTHKIYVLMESCGTNLSDIIKKHQTTDISISSTLYKWLRPIAIGIQCMQSANLIHHDIKPANIQISANNEAKLSGFKFIKSEEYNIHKPIKKVTSEDKPENAALKMACVYTHPQILINPTEQKYRMLGDIYSLGITFIECAFALQHQAKYIALLGNALLYSIFRHTNTEEILLTETTTIELDDIGYISTPQRGGPPRLSIEKITYNLNEPIGTTGFTVREIYNNVAKVKTDYPFCMKIIKDEIRTIDEIISVFDTSKPTSQ